MGILLSIGPEKEKVHDVGNQPERDKNKTCKERHGNPTKHKNRGSILGSSGPSESQEDNETNNGQQEGY
jgi:hypothetical protein